MELTTGAEAEGPPDPARTSSESIRRRYVDYVCRHVRLDHGQVEVLGRLLAERMVHTGRPRASAGLRDAFREFRAFLSSDQLDIFDRIVPADPD